MTNEFFVPKVYIQPIFSWDNRSDEQLREETPLPYKVIGNDVPYPVADRLPFVLSFLSTNDPSIVDL